MRELGEIRKMQWRVLEALIELNEHVDVHLMAKACRCSRTHAQAIMRQYREMVPGNLEYDARMDVKAWKRSAYYERAYLPTAVNAHDFIMQYSNVMNIEQVLF